MPNTFPNTKVTPLETTDSLLGGDTKYKDLPCIFCMCKGEFDRFATARRGTMLVEISDLVKLTLCPHHAEDFVGDKR